MSKYLRIFSLILATLMCLFVLASCKNETTPPAEQPPADTPVTEEEVPRLPLFEGGASKYTLVYPSGANADVLKASKAITDAFKAKTNVAMATAKDSDRAADDATFEILFGKTNRSQSVVPEIASTSVWYSVAVSGNKIIINASNDYMLEFAATVFIAECITNTEEGVVSIPANYNATKEFVNFYSPMWTLDDEVPYFETAGTYAPNLYNCGSHFTTFYNDTTGGDTMMLCINNSSRNEVNAYVEKLIACDYRVVSEMAPEFAYFTRLTNGIKSVIVSYESSTRVARVTVEEGVATPEDISYVVEAAENSGAEFYQFGLLNDVDSSTSGAQTHGMCHVIKLADNSVIIIDGGVQSQMQGNTGNYSPAAELDTFLHDITGTPSNKKVTIACWYLTHPHDDHYGGFLEFIQRYPQKYNLKCVMTNLPDNGTDAANSGGTTPQGWHNCVRSWAPIIQMYYPKCVMYKPHTGDQIQFADVKIQILFTHEDLVDPTTGKTLVNSDLNDVSTVTKISTTGMSMVITGDASSRVEAKMPQYYSTGFLKSDIIQLAHHGANELHNVYNLVRGKYAFIPGCVERLTAGNATDDARYERIMTTIRRYATKEYYSGSFRKTIGLAYRYGQITEIYSQK
ncbi:MAG: hypothetical protein E7653_01260 [Ruminococcaceae bacterium]|nr:hypothetical protein [Oscillospiraceae bacterium]